jgi:tRNA uridine 5-carboxymethylaminomethyl modification enzyme
VAAEDTARIPELESHKGRSFEQALRDPRVSIEMLAALDGELSAAERPWRSLAEAGVKYEGYIARQEEQVGRFRRMEEKQIPRDFDWDALSGVSSEAKEKLKLIRPISVGQASRISGVRPPDIAILMVSLKRDTRQAGS